jgi:hypothetical protein
VRYICISSDSGMRSPREFRVVDASRMRYFVVGDGVVVIVVVDGVACKMEVGRCDDSTSAVILMMNDVYISNRSPT